MGKKLPKVELKGVIHQLTTGGYKVVLNDGKYAFFVTEKAALGWLEDNSR